MFVTIWLQPANLQSHLHTNSLLHTRISLLPNVCATQLIKIDSANNVFVDLVKSFETAHAISCRRTAHRRYSLRNNIKLAVKLRGIIIVLNC